MGDRSAGGVAAAESHHLGFEPPRRGNEDLGSAVESLDPQVCSPRREGGATQVENAAPVQAGKTSTSEGLSRTPEVERTKDAGKGDFIARRVGRIDDLALPSECERDARGLNDEHR
ncbi:MAG TPA: hypothetical protein VK736_02375, partial [Candidatus Binatia bacterium]|nr:hypothetical protein [Candidatus Binatia bacterium]